MTTLDTPTPTSGPVVYRGTAVAIVAVAVAIALFARLSFLGQPFQNDAGIYIYLGKVLWTGGRLYQDLWETKLPTVALLTAPVYAAFGNAWWAYVVLQAAMGIVAAVVLAGAVGRYVHPAGRLPTLVFGLVAFNVSRLTITGFQLETVQLFFETLAAAAALRCLARPTGRAGAVVGVLAAAAAFAKPTGLAVALAAGVALLWQLARRRGGWGPLVGLVVGVTVPVAAAVGWVCASSFGGEMPGVLREIGLYASGTPWRSLVQVKTGVFFLLPLVPWAVRASLTRPAPQRSAFPPPAPGVVLFAAVWMAAEVVAVVLQRRLYSYHFLVLMPPAALLFGLRPRTGGAWPVVAGLAPLAALSMVYALPGWASWRHARHAPSVAAYVAAHTAPADAVWADPACGLLLEADRRPGSRLQMTFYFVNHDGAPRQFADQLLADFDARRPALIVLTADWRDVTAATARDTPGLKWNPARRAAYGAACDRVWAYVQSHYHLEAEVAGHSVYRRNASGSARTRSDARYQAGLRYAEDPGLRRTSNPA